jgi:PAS domain S-box-containing protein
MNRNPQTVNILIVEDERIIALNLKENLESLGYSVPAIAASGHQAVEKARQFHPDLVLMDIRLQGTMDGISAAEEIWENLSIPVIYVTGHSDPSTLERAKMTAPFGYILKPIKERELAVAIEIALQRYEREHLLNAILKGMGDGVMVVNRQERVEFLNPMAQVLTGWPLCEARSQPLSQVFNLIDEYYQPLTHNPITTALQQDTPVHLPSEVLLKSKDGKTIPIGDSATPIKDSKGTIIGAVVVFQDISHRKQAENAIRQQLEQEQKLNQLKTQIIYTVSHEYRTPLATILASAQLLESQVRVFNPDKLLRNSQRIQASVHYMVRLLEDMLTLNQYEAGELAFNPIDLDLESFCCQFVAEYQLIAGDKHQIQWMGEGKNTIICVDKRLLQQMLNNLLSNALKYSPDGGTITLTLTSNADNVNLQVQDQGIGIPLAEQTQIFEPFYRAVNVEAMRGMGMGLAIVKKAVDLHGGAIALKSQIGVGTTFIITLPREQE